jgi:hypothetical protein
MISPNHPLRRIFHELVRDCLRADSDVQHYIADMLTEFTSADKLYPVRDAGGRPVGSIDALLHASDPVHGTAASFDDERRLRKHLGDFLLFTAGMAPRNSSSPERLDRMVRTGQESYWVVSQFNLFEYEQEAPLFLKLSAAFEPSVQGLNEVYRRLQRNGSDLLM